VKAEVVLENKENENFCGGINLFLTFLNMPVESTILASICRLLNNCRRHWMILFIFLFSVFHFFFNSPNGKNTSHNIINGAYNVMKCMPVNYTIYIEPLRTGARSVSKGTLKCQKCTACQSTYALLPRKIEANISTGKKRVVNFMLPPLYPSKIEPMIVIRGCVGPLKQARQWRKINNRLQLESLISSLQRVFGSY
jgi:hypothetical protein